MLDVTAPVCNTVGLLWFSQFFYAQRPECSDTNVRFGRRDEGCDFLVYKDTDTAKCSGTATRPSNVELKYYCLILIAIILILDRGAAISSVQVLLQCGWENSEASLGKECGGFTYAQFITEY